MSDKTPHTNKGEVLSDIIGNLSTSLSWYHGRQPEVFLQHDSHCARQDVLELRSRTSKRELVQILGSSKSIRQTNHCRLITM